MALSRELAVARKKTTTSDYFGLSFPPSMHYVASSMSLSGALFAWYSCLYRGFLSLPSRCGIHHIEVFPAMATLGKSWLMAQNKISSINGIAVAKAGEKSALAIIYQFHFAFQLQAFVGGFSPSNSAALQRCCSFNDSFSSSPKRDNFSHTKTRNRQQLDEISRQTQKHLRDRSLESL